MPGAPQIFDRRLIRTRRDRIAASGEAPDFLLARVADDFAERLSIVRREFPRAVSLGAYSGVLAQRLRALPNVGEIMDVDPSIQCLKLATGLRVAAEEDALPFAAQSLDLVVSGLSLQLVNDLPGALVQINRALKPDGLLLTALLAGETLKELREAWLLAELEMLGGASPRVAPFADVRELGRLLQRAGFALPVADSDIVRVTYRVSSGPHARDQGDGRQQHARRAEPYTGDAPAAFPGGGDLSEQVRPAQRPYTGDIRNHHADGVGAAPKSAEAAGTRIGAGPSRRRFET